MPDCSTLPKSSIASILKIYGIKEAFSHSLLSGGSENTNFLIEGHQKKWVLTICEQKTLEEAQRLTALLSFLEKNNYRTSTIFPTVEHQQVSIFDGKPVMLKSYLEGNIDNDLNVGVLVQIGKALAELNQLQAPDFLPKHCAYGEQIFDQKLMEGIKPTFLNWLKPIQALIEPIFNEDLPRGLIHSDLFFSNVIVRQDELVAIMDFEEACESYRMFDLGMAITGLCSLNGSFDKGKIGALIQGYQQVLLLTQKEKERLPIFVIYAATTTAFWRYRQFNIVKPDPAQKKRYQEMVDLVEEVLAMPKTAFTKWY